MSTHGPVDQEYRDMMQAIVTVLDDSFNRGAKGDARKVGFCLLVFPFGEEPEGRINYVSNGARREDMITALRELADRFEGTHPEEQ